MTKRALLTLLIAALVAVPTFAADHGAAGCCATSEGVERTVTQLTDGIKVTLTAKDATTAEKLRSRANACSKDACADCPMHAEGVVRTVDTTENGVTITATSTDAALVAKLQQYAAGSGCQARQSSTKPECCRSKAAHAGCQSGRTANP